MYKIILSTNDSANKNITCVVSKNQYSRIQQLENLGGFKRFDIELYSDDEPKQKSEIKECLNWLGQFVFYMKNIDFVEFFNKLI